MSIRDEDFAYFIKKFGEATFKKDVPEKSLQKYNGVLPEQLLQYWKVEGWCAYANGLFWTVNPEDYNDLVEQWLDDSHYPKIDKFHCFARTAFGVLYLWGEKNNQWFTLSCPTNVIVAFDQNLLKVNKNSDSSIRAFFGASSLKGYDIRGLNQQGLFSSAFTKLGHLKPNEVYGFAPALAAGGSLVVENIEKEDLFIHLSILREMAAPILPYSNVDIEALMKEQE